MKPTLNDIKIKAEALAIIIEAPYHLLPAFDGSLNHAEVVIDEKGFLYYVTQDQGMDTREYHLCLDEDDLLYRIFDAITCTMATDFRAKNPRDGNSKYPLHAEQEKLLGRLNADWEKRKHAENWDIWH